MTGDEVGNIQPRTSNNQWENWLRVVVGVLEEEFEDGAGVFDGVDGALAGLSAGMGDGDGCSEWESDIGREIFAGNLDIAEE